MKIKAFILFITVLLSIALISCESTKKAEPEELTPEEQEYRRSVGKNAAVVSKETFNADKAAILKKIQELNIIMSNYDYKSWLKYIDSDSQIYWSNKVNLVKYSEKLPKEEKQKGNKLQSLKDYFSIVFIKARRGRQIDEIRYNSADSIKAVQIRQREDGSTEAIVYYNFVKQDGEWKVYLPRL